MKSTRRVFVLFTHRHVRDADDHAAVGLGRRQAGRAGLAGQGGGAERERRHFGSEKCEEAKRARESATPSLSFLRLERENFTPS